MQTEQSSRRAVKPTLASGRPAPVFERASGLYGEVMTLPATGRGGSAAAKLKASF